MLFLIAQLYYNIGLIGYHPIYLNDIILSLYINKLSNEEIIFHRGLLLNF